MSKKRRGRESKYTEAFKRQLVAESRASRATVPVVSKRHGVPTIQDHPVNRIGELMPWAYQAMVEQQKAEIEVKNGA